MPVLSGAPAQPVSADATTSSPRAPARAGWHRSCESAFDSSACSRAPSALGSPGGPRCPPARPSARKRAAGPVRLALLGGRPVQTARRFPGLIVGLHLRLGDQHQRLAIQARDLPAAARARSRVEVVLVVGRVLGAGDDIRDAAPAAADACRDRAADRRPASNRLAGAA